MKFLKFMIFVFFSFCIKVSYLYSQDSQEISAQKYLEIIEKQNQQKNGYYEGSLDILQQNRKKQTFDFVFLKKEHNIFWEFRQFEQIQYRVLCNQKNQSLYFYDKKRDVVYNKKEEQILSEWYFIPYFVFCGIILEPILDPERIEKGTEILIRAKFFYPKARHFIIVNANLNFRLKKFLLFTKNNQKEMNTHRIFFLYEPSRIIDATFPNRIEVIDTIKNSVAVFRWILYYEKYKVDDIRFIPEFLSR